MKEEIKEEKEVKFSVQKFTKQAETEELTEQNVKDIIFSQEKEIENLEKEIARKRECITHYTQYLTK